MKRIFAVVILFMTSITVFAQQSNRISSRPTPEQTRENMKQYLEQVKSKVAQFDSIQADLKDRNAGNDEERRFNKLKTEIEGLETSIRLEQYKISSALEKGITVSKETLDNVEKMLVKHKEKVTELDFITSSFSSAK